MSRKFFSGVKDFLISGKLFRGVKDFSENAKSFSRKKTSCFDRSGREKYFYEVCLKARRGNSDRIKSPRKSGIFSATLSDVANGGYAKAADRALHGIGTQTDVNKNRIRMKTACFLGFTLPHGRDRALRDNTLSTVTDTRA